LDCGGRSSQSPTGQIETRTRYRFPIRPEYTRGKYKVKRELIKLRIFSISTSPGSVETGLKEWGVERLPFLEIEGRLDMLNFKGFICGIILFGVAAIGYVAVRT